MSEATVDTAPRRGAQIRAIIVTLVALALVLGGLFAWRALRAGNQPAWQQQAVPVAVVVVTPQEVPQALEAVGSLTAVQEVMLSPEVAGRVSDIRFTAGSTVGQGALLVQLFDGPERADRKAAQARVAFAAVQLARSEKLASSGAEPREMLLQHRAEHEQARAAVEQIDARLVQKQVRAPFAGEVGIRRVNPGQYLNPGDPVATLTALDRLYVDFALPQQELARLKPGQLVSVTSDSWPGRVFSARVNAVEPRIGEDTRNVTAQATLSNPARELRPGMYVTASLALPPQQNALVVPTTAILTSAQGNSAVVVRGKEAVKQGKAEIVPVVTGARIGNSVVVTSGLKAGDVVVSEGQLRVQPGAEVKVVRTVSAGGR